MKTDKHLAPGQPQKPTNLSARAASEWDRIVGELAASQIRVTPAHRTVLSQAATISADIAEAWRHIVEDGGHANRATQRPGRLTMARGRPWEHRRETRVG